MKTTQIEMCNRYISTVVITAYIHHICDWQDPYLIRNISMLGIRHRPQMPTYIITKRVILETAVSYPWHIYKMLLLRWRNSINLHKSACNKVYKTMIKNNSIRSLAEIVLTLVKKAKDISYKTWRLTLPGVTASVHCQIWCRNEKDDLLTNTDAIDTLG